MIELSLGSERFGRLVATQKKKILKGNRNRTYWECVCDCGSVVDIRQDQLKSGTTRSCGCLKIDQDRKNLDQRTHGDSGERLYKIWLGMKARCNNPNVECYPRYGGRGIKVCDSWNEDYTIFKEWALKNGYSDDLTIDRIDNLGDYGPENCRWATNKEQANNRRTTNKVEHKGETMSLMELSEKTGASYSALKVRYRQGKRGKELLKHVNIS